jgi:hypothetical protein
MEGDWVFPLPRIHTTLMSGMGRVFTYQNQAPNPLIPNPNLAQRKLFGEKSRKFQILLAENDFADQIGNDGMAMLQNTKNGVLVHE